MKYTILPVTRAAPHQLYVTRQAAAEAQSKLA